MPWTVWERLDSKQDKHSFCSHEIHGPVGETKLMLYICAHTYTYTSVCGWEGQESFLRRYDA